MGGHHTKQSVKLSSDVVTNGTLNVTQNCIAFMDGTQVISIYGSGIIFKGNIQRSQIGVNMECVDHMGQQGGFENKLVDSVTQKLRDQEQALTEWLDPGGSNQRSDVSQKVSTNITFNNVQNCLARLNGTQLFVVTGSNDVVVDNLQEQTLNLAQQCLLSGGQVVDVVNDVTNTVNQHSVYDSQNPLAFITDAFDAVLKSSMALAAVVFIALIILVSVFKIGTRGNNAQKREATPGGRDGFGGVSAE
jgi:hypothetical protein